MFVAGGGIAGLVAAGDICMGLISMLFGMIREPEK